MKRYETIAAFESALRARLHVPAVLPRPPEAWRVPYRRLAQGLPVPPDLDGGYEFAAYELAQVLASLQAETAGQGVVT